MKNYVVTVLSVIMLISINSSLAQWIPTNGPPVKEDYHIACMEFLNSNIYTGISCGGIFYSADNGMNWLQNSFPNQCVWSLDIMNEHIIAGTYENGFYVSHDGGNTWVNSNNGIPNGDIGRINDVFAILINNDKVYGAVNNKGIFLSEDYGNNWVEINKGLTNFNVFCLVASDQTIYAGTKEGIFKLEKNSDKWVNLNFNLPQRTIVYALAIKGNTIIAGTNNGIFRCNKMEADWIETNLQQTQVRNENKSKFDEMKNYKREVIFSLTAFGEYIFAGTENSGIFVSNNDGRTWRKFDKGLPQNTTVYPLSIYKSTLYAGVERKIWLRKLDNINQVDD